MSKENSLETILWAQTLRKALLIIAVISALLVIIAGVLAHKEVRESNQRRLQAFADSLLQNIESIQQQVGSLARNDLIINSLIDYSNRDNYLPVFFRSLEFTVKKDVSLAFTDFQGSTITGKNLDTFAIKSKAYDWQSSVLEEARPYFDYSTQGLMIAHPVIYANAAEGAIAVHIGSFEALITTPSVGIAALLDQNGRVIYSTNQRLLEIGSIFEKGDYAAWYQTEQAFGKDRLLKLEPLSSAYSEMIWLVASIAIALALLLAGSIYAIRVTSRLASSSLKQLELSIIQAKENYDSGPAEFVAIKNEPEEFRVIRESFYGLLANLTATSFSRDQFEGVINSLNELLVVVDHDFKVIIINRCYSKWCKRIGWDPDDQETIQKLIPQELMQASSVPIQLSVEKNYQIKEQDNNSPVFTLRWVRNEYSNAEGQLVGHIFVAANVTQEKQLQSELLVKNRAIDEAATPIVLADASKEDLPLSYVNDAFTRMTGYEASDVLGLNCRFLQGSETSPEAVDRLRTAIREEKTEKVVLLNYRKDGKPFFNELSISPIYNDQGNLTHYLGIQVDVTERENTEKYLVEAKNKAEESARLKSEFLATMSHEIRTPINGVMGMLNLLLGTDLNQDQRHHAELAKSSADSLLHIINDILDFSKVEAGKLTIEKIQFDLYQLFSNCIESFAQKAQDKGLEIVLDASGIEYPMVEGDPGRLRQILTNLIGNAIKFTKTGSIVVTADLLRGSGRFSRLICSVKDTGSGIPPQRLDHIFDAFTQGDSSTTRRYGGSGLGLSISKQLCHLMGGFINASSQMNKGSTFSFEIELKALNTPSKLIHYSELDALEVLLVDDCQHVLACLQRQLMAWGCEVRTAKTGPEAEQAVQSWQPKLVLIDKDLGDEDGIEVGRHLKSLASTQAATLVLMTSVNQHTNAPYFRTMGFHYTFPKPATIPDLQHCLHVTTKSKTADSDEAPLQASEGQAPGPLTSSGRKHRVLLVEDNHTNQIVAQALLEEAGVVVDIAANGQKAIEALNDHNDEQVYSAVFMDCQMPVMDGFVATEKIRSGEAGPQYANVAIIAMTANAMQGDRERCLQSGMNDYISKPVDPDELQRKVEHWLGLVTSVSGVIDTENLPTPSAAIWSKEHSLERMMGREDLFKKVIGSFLEDLPEILKGLEQAIEGKDFNQTRYHAHTLKGAASNVGADEVAQLALEIELAAKGTKEALIARYWSELQPALDRALPLIEEFFAAPS